MQAKSNFGGSGDASLADDERTDNQDCENEQWQSDHFPVHGSVRNEICREECGALQKSDDDERPFARCFEEGREQNKRDQLNRVRPLVNDGVSSDEN